MTGAAKSGAELFDVVFGLSSSSSSDGESSTRCAAGLGWVAWTARPPALLQNADRLALYSDMLTYSPGCRSAVEPAVIAFVQEMWDQEASTTNVQAFSSIDGLKSAKALLKKKTNAKYIAHDDAAAVLVNIQINIDMIRTNSKK
eukprot:gene7857-32474_t